jgi:hypothetical protein
MSDEDYVPEPEVKQEPRDFWDEEPRAAPAHVPEEIPKEVPVELQADEQAGGRGKAMRERWRQLRLQKMRNEKKKDDVEDRDEMHLQDYKDALSKHERYKIRLNLS